MRPWRTLLLAALALCAATGASFDRDLERGEERLREGRYADAIAPLEAAVGAADREPPERQVRGSTT